METKRMQMDKPRPDDGGPLNMFGGIVNGNAEERAALRDADAAMRAADEAGRRADARRQAKERQIQLSLMLRDCSAFFVGICVMMLAVFPTWMGLAALVASVYIRLYAAKLAREAGKND